MSLTAEEVLTAAQAWVWVPPGSPDVQTEDCRVIAYPRGFTNPTVATSISSQRPAAEVVDAVLTTAGGLGRSDVTFWTHESTRPADLVDELLARGAVLDEELAVLARPLDELPDLAMPGDVEVRSADDLATVRDVDRVGVAVFGGQDSTDVELVEGLAASDISTGLGLAAYRDGRPVGAAGITIRDGVARLWGGAVLEEARHTGVYRALLARRLATAVEHGCRMALSKGRIATSAPILGRAGFVVYGAETTYRLSP